MSCERTGIYPKKPDLSTLRSITHITVASEPPIIDDNNHLNYGPRLGFGLQAANIFLQNAGYTHGLDKFAIREIDIRYRQEVMAGDELEITTQGAQLDQTIDLSQTMKRGDMVASNASFVVTKASDPKNFWDPLQQIRVFERDRGAYLAQHELSVKQLRENGIFIFIAKLHMEHNGNANSQKPILEVTPLRDRRFVSFHQERGPLTSVCTIAVVTPGETTMDVAKVIQRIVGE